MTRTSTDRKAPDQAGTAWMWITIGLLSFGGPAGQIALMSQEVVEKRRLVESDAFDRGLSFSMMLPGPEAQQLATWLGWRIGGLAGGLTAGLAFIIPGMALMLLLAWVAAAYGEVPIIAAVFAAVQPVVIAVVIQALWKIAARALNGPAFWALAVAAFLGLAVAGLPFPLIVALAAVAGLAIARLGRGTVDPAKSDAPVAVDWSWSLRVVAVATALVFGTYLLTRALAGAEPYDDVAALFTTAAFVTFGGAYAVLPFVAERAVESYAWLGPEAMLNGLAIAEATPGPLILVNTYAGFFAGWSAAPGSGAGVLSGVLATFYTFAPSFMLILAFAPVVERIQNVPWARQALAGVSAAVVGVIANLAIFLGQASFFPTGFTDPAWAKLVLFAAAMGMVFGLGVSMLRLVGLGIVAGVVLHLVGLL
ncbi:MAG: chromate efflux transporter [Pseudomonadota bacterium]